MTPFDKNRYGELLKGLEISEVQLSDLERTMRMDSEFYAREHLVAEIKLRTIGAHPLTDVANVSDGNHMGVSDDFCRNGVPYYRGGDIKSFFLAFGHPEYCVPQEVYDMPTMTRSHIHKGDVLVSIVGAIIGQIGMKTDTAPALCSCKLGILRPKSQLAGAYLASFMLSCFGQAQIRRLRRGSAQTGLILDDFNQIFVPEFTKDFYGAIERTICSALEAHQKTSDCIELAKSTLLADLGFADWTPPIETVSIKSYADFLSSHRLDAEYYQPKYDDLLARLRLCKCRDLGGKEGLVSMARSVEPGSDCYSDSGIPFIRIADFSESGIGTPEIHLPKELYADYPRPKKDTILLSKDGSVCIAYKVDEDLDVVTSSGILHLTVKDASVLPDYLTLILNSRLVRMQAERDAGGSIIQHWKQSEIEKVQIPILPMKQQQKLSAKVRESFSLRAESKRLLDLAKYAVELAIKQGEERAMELLSEEICHAK